MHGGMEEFEGGLNVLAANLHRWYSLLDDKAIMFIQTPPIRDPDVAPELKKFLDKLSLVPGLDVSYTKMDIGHGYTFLRLQRDENAPADLRPYF